MLQHGFIRHGVIACFSNFDAGVAVCSERRVSRVIPRISLVFCCMAGGATENAGVEISARK